MRATRGWAIGVISVLAAGALLLFYRGDGARAGGVQQAVLANGVTVVLCPVAGADQVAIEVFHPAGFLHEPAGFTQATHLIEHLVCRGATAGYGPGETMRLLTERGMANAETMADATHYDYVLPAANLELAARIIGERLAGVTITAPAITQEAANCYGEADTVERNPAAGMIKHAFMALNQAWRGQPGPVQVRGGLTQIPIADLGRFYQAAYRPQQAVVVVVGGFEPKQARALLDKYVGRVPRSTAPAVTTPDWARQPKQQAVPWDTGVTAVCLAFPPPPERADRLLLAAWGALLMQRLSTDAELQGVAHAVFTTNPGWTPGALPIFAYATARPGVTAGQLQAALAAKVQRAAVAPVSQAELGQLRMVLAQLLQAPPTDLAAIRQQAEMLAPQIGQTPKQATGFVLGNLAIQLGLCAMELGPDPAPVRRALGSVTAEQLQRLLATTLDPARCRVTILQPTR